MISLDQILLLEQKVDAAIVKINQLQNENATLRKSVAELTASLSAKSNDLSILMQEQGKIETGILTALEKLATLDTAAIPPQGNVIQGEALASESAQEDSSGGEQSEEGAQFFGEDETGANGDASESANEYTSENTSESEQGSFDEGVTGGASGEGTEQLAAGATDTGLEVDAGATSLGGGEAGSGNQAENATFDIF